MLVEALPYAQRAKEILTNLHSGYSKEAEDTLLMIEKDIDAED